MFMYQGGSRPSSLEGQFTHVEMLKFMAHDIRRAPGEKYLETNTPFSIHNRNEEYKYDDIHVDTGNPYRLSALRRIYFLYFNLSEYGRSCPKLKYQSSAQVLYIWAT